MSIKNKVAQYRAYKTGTLHCTFNPKGRGVVRIHLVPPKFKLLANPRYIVILNGYYILPLGYSWAVLLSAFMNGMNEWNGEPMTEADVVGVFNAAVISTARIYPTASNEQLERDLQYMLDVFYAVCRGERIGLEKMSIREYAPNMTAPHRVDLMVSAMTDTDGRWNCNQKCMFCYAAGQTRSSERSLSSAQWKAVIDKLSGAGVPMVTFTGGEPTLRDDLCELIDYAKRFVTRLNTNGLKLTRTFARALAEASLDSVQITLYSSEPSIHNRLVGNPDGFGLTSSGIANALAEGLDVSVNTPLFSLNADYASTLRYLRGLGVRYVTCSGLICTGNASSNSGEFDLPRERLAEILSEAVDVCCSLGMEIDFTSPGLVASETLDKLGLNIPQCGACLSNMAVSPGGEVIPCQSWLNGSGLGNILETPWKEIWNNSQCKSLRAMSDKTAINCPFRSPKQGCKDEKKSEN